MSDSGKSGFSAVDREDDPSFYVNCLRRQYAGQRALHGHKEQTLALAAPQPGEIVLDAGCGLGLDSQQMAAAVAPAGRVYGIDASQEMIAAARQDEMARRLPLTFQQESIYQLSFADESFDLCRADKVFQHLDDPQAALRELARVTRPGGRILIADPDHDSLIIDTPYTDLNQRFVRWRSGGLAQGGVAHQLYGLFKAAGLTDVRVVPLTTVFTNYEEKRVTSPYLQEIWYAHEQGVFTRAEAEQWSGYLQQAIAADRFFCLQTYIITLGTKG